MTSYTGNLTVHNPAFVDVAASGTTTRTRYGSSLGGDLGLSISSNSTTTAQVILADPHGDVVATSDITATATPAIGIAGWADHDEYGNPIPASSVASLTKGVGYGWVGAKQRATLDTGLLLMGARIYDPTTGQFTSTDPVYGGNDTTYGYPNDPVNDYDLNGQWGFHCGWCNKVVQVVTRVAVVASYIPGPIGTVAGGVAAIGYAAQGRWRQAALYGFSALTAGAGKYINSARSFIRNGNNVFRMGRSAGKFRVSIGPTYRYWKHSSGFVRRHMYWNIHADRGYGAFKNHRTGYYRKWWGS